MNRIILIILALVIVVVVAGILTAEYYTAQPQFCGSCHIMKSYYKTWEKSKHGEKGVSCVNCHYAPGEHGTLKAKFKGLGQLFSYLGTGEEIVQKAAFVNDLSCTTSDCHPTTGKGKEGEYWTKKIKFTEYVREDKSKAAVSFTHEAHFDKEKWVEGQEKHCSICHRHETGKKHMEVSKETCNLCHFKNTKFAEERAKCSLCHKIPEEPFKKAEKPDEKPITHKELEDRKVSCAGCHLELIKGNGEIKQEKCLDCHENEEKIMKEVKNIKLMHEKHVAAQTAHCFSCHEPIQHKKGIKEFTYVDAALDNCKVCHPEPHLNQRLLIAGEGGTGIDKPYPIKHHVVKTNCIACHVKDAYDEKGRKIKAAEAKNCVACHTEKEGKLIKKWESDVADILKEARDIEKEAIGAINEAKGKVSEEAIQKAMVLLKDGQENLRIVDAGGGVHNKKYSVLLMDIAIENFEDAVAELKTE